MYLPYEDMEKSKEKDRERWKIFYTYPIQIKTSIFRITRQNGVDRKHFKERFLFLSTKGSSHQKDKVILNCFRHKHIYIHIFKTYKAKPGRSERKNWKKSILGDFNITISTDSIYR